MKTARKQVMLWLIVALGLCKESLAQAVFFPSLYGTTGKNATPSVLYQLDPTTNPVTSIIVQQFVGGIIRPAQRLTVRVNGIDYQVSISGMAFDRTLPIPRDGVLYMITSGQSPNFPDALLEYRFVNVVSANRVIDAGALIGFLGIQNVEGLAINDAGDLYAWAFGPESNPINQLVVINKSPIAPMTNNLALTVGANNFDFTPPVGLDFTRDIDAEIPGAGDELILIANKQWYKVDISDGGTKQQSRIVGLFGSCGAGAIDPTNLLDFWCPEIRGFRDVNTRIQNIEMFGETSFNDEIFTTLTDLRTLAFTFAVTQEPSAVPSAKPSTVPSASPSRLPSASPSSMPSSTPSASPSRLPSSSPSSSPSSVPSASPSSQPSSMPSASPSRMPSATPSTSPSAAPSPAPSATPSTSRHPSAAPSPSPSSAPSATPSASPSATPSASPTKAPTPQPTVDPCTTNGCSGFLGFPGLQVHGFIPFTNICVEGCYLAPFSILLDIVGAVECGPCPGP